MSQNFEKLCEAVEAARVDVQKAEEGNKAATSRVRKAMQEVKNLAQSFARRCWSCATPAASPPDAHPPAGTSVPTATDAGS